MKERLISAAAAALITTGAQAATAISPDGGTTASFGPIEFQDLLSPTFVDGADLDTLSASSFQDAGRDRVGTLSDSVVMPRMAGVPEPGTAALMLSALLGLGFAARRRAT